MPDIDTQIESVVDELWKISEPYPTYFKKAHKAIKALLIQQKGGLDKPSDTASVGGNQVDKLDEFAEFCHSYYNGCSLNSVGKWIYGYDHEVITMVALFQSQKLIVDAVVTDLATTDHKPSKTSSNPQSKASLKRELT